MAEWSTHLIAALWLTLPIVVGGVAHMYAVSHQWLEGLKIPIHARWFGANKTWRGVVLMPLLTIPGAWLLHAASPWWPGSLHSLQAVPSTVLGLALGLGYILMELPNSFIKRRLGIAPGETPEHLKALFILIDQWDSAIGFTLAYALLTDLPATTLLTLILIFPAVALGVKRLLFVLCWKEKAV